MELSLSNRYTLIPTSIILGLGGSPLWSAKCTYLTIAGNMQAAREGKKGSDIINQYFGIFFFIFQSSAVWGNLMSSLIFGQDTKIGRRTRSVLVAVFSLVFRVIEAARISYASVRLNEHVYCL